MRLDDGDAALTEVRIWLTIAEARQTIAVLTDLLDDIERVGLPESHSHLSSTEREVTVFVYPDATTLEADHNAEFGEPRV